MKAASCSTTAYERVVAGHGSSRVLISCEHASNQMPDGWQWPDPDRWLEPLHWAWDIGAADLCRGLAHELEAVAVLSRFTRLLIDPNRPLGSPTLFRSRADGRDITFNQNISAEEQERRISQFWRPYHEAIAEAIDFVHPQLVLAVHSYTPLFEGQPREVEVGVLHADQAELAAWWCDALRSRSDLDVRVNEPYSGAGGFMYSAEHHAALAGCPAIEIELRQDIAADPARKTEMVQLFADCVRACLAEDGPLHTA